MKAIDVSNYNSNINWEIVKSSGIDAVYIKATEGTTYIDPSLSKHYIGAANAGLNVGFYHFLTGKSAPETQAENFYNNIKDKNSRLRVCIDIESTGFDINLYIKAFINKLSTLIDIPKVIYASAYFARDYIDSEVKNNYPLWVAHYGVDPWGSKINTGFNDVIGHQYSENGKISGVPGYCDLDVFNDMILINGRNDVPAGVVSKPSSYVHNQKILELQMVCNKVNNAGLALDGFWGPLTDSAVKKLHVAGLPYRTPDLTVWLQLRLGCEPDGIFGPKTYNATIWWQKHHNLVVDGLAGYNTIKSLAYA